MRRIKEILMKSLFIFAGIIFFINGWTDECMTHCYVDSSCWGRVYAFGLGGLGLILLGVLFKYNAEDKNEN